MPPGPRTWVDDGGPVSGGQAGVVDLGHAGVLGEEFGDGGGGGVLGADPDDEGADAAGEQ
jgi:hypothetical protein